MSTKIRVEDLNFYYGKTQALKGINLNILDRQVTALIGPSGCGKSTFIRTLNRMNDIIPGTKVEGSIFLDGTNIYESGVDIVNLRRRIGMLFQRPNPFPKSVFENIAFGLRISKKFSRSEVEVRVIKCLQEVGLWEEVKDRLYQSSLTLLPGQQQLLCIARLLVVEPEVILMDEPCSALDPLATLRIEELIRKLKQNYTVIIVTHNMQQAARVSEVTGFFYLGELIEYGSTSEIFTRPRDRRTEDFITGRFG